MTKKWHVLPLVLLFSIVSVYALTPSRCTFNPYPGVSCNEFDINKSTGTLQLAFTNKFGQSGNFSFNAWLEKNSALGEKRIAALSCLCNGSESCLVNAEGNAAIICDFGYGAVPTEENAKFSIEGNVFLTDNAEIPIKIEGQVYYSIHDADSSDDVFFPITVNILIIACYIFLIIFIGKSKKLTNLLKSSLKNYLILALVFFIIINFFSFWVSGFYHSLILLAQFLLISLILALPLGLVFAVIIYIKDKKKPEKK